jgi:hypothetical protein
MRESELARYAPLITLISDHHKTIDEMKYHSCKLFILLGFLFAQGEARGTDEYYFPPSAPVCAKLHTPTERHHGQNNKNEELSK